jgi:hypothetical protein
MALARYQFTVTDAAGNVVPDATVTVRREIPGAPLVPLYSDRNGTSSLGNPILSDADGFVFFHCAGGAYQIIATKGAFSRTWRYVGIGLMAETDGGAPPLLGDHKRVTGASDSIGTADMLVTIERAGPTTTALALPAVETFIHPQLLIADYSSDVTDSPGHLITITPNGTQKIMRQSTWPLFSNSASLASVRLIPVIALPAWIVV